MENVKYFYCDQIGYIAIDGTLSAPQKIKLVEIRKLQNPYNHSIVEDVYDLDKNRIIKPNASLLGDYNLLYDTSGYMTRTGKKFGLNKTIDLPELVLGYLSHGERTGKSDKIIYSREKLSILENYINSYLKSELTALNLNNDYILESSERE